MTVHAIGFKQDPGGGAAVAPWTHTRGRIDRPESAAGDPGRMYTFGYDQDEKSLVCGAARLRRLNHVGELPSLLPHEGRPGSHLLTGCGPGWGAPRSWRAAPQPSGQPTIVSANLGWVQSFSVPIELVTALFSPT